jgi:hypothetical protein
VVEVGDEAISAQAPATGGWDNFQTVELGEIQVKQPGALTVKVRAKDKSTWKSINVNSMKLTMKD